MWWPVGGGTFMKPRFHLFWLALAGGASGAAMAQVPERGIEFAAGSSLIHDDNVFRLPDGVAPAAGNRSDWIIAPYVSARGAAPLGAVQLAIDANLAYRFHRNNEELDREQISAQGTVATRLVACNVELSGRFARQQSDLADILGGTSLVNVENRTTLSADALCGDEIGLRPGLGYVRMMVSNSADERSLSDYRSDQITASLGYSRPAFGLLSLYGSYRDGAYPNRPPAVPGGAANDEVRVYSAGLSYRREIGSRLGGRVALGYMKVKPRADAVPDFSGISYSADLSFHGSNRLSGTVSVSRSAEQSNLLDVNYAITTSYTASLRYVLTTFLSFAADAAWQKRKFEPSAAAPTLVSGSDRLTQIGAGLKYRLGRRIDLGLSGRHQRRGADLAALRYSANSVIFSAGLKF